MLKQLKALKIKTYKILNSEQKYWNKLPKLKHKRLKVGIGRGKMVIYETFKNARLGHYIIHH